MTVYAESNEKRVKNSLLNVLAPLALALTETGPGDADLTRGFAVSHFPLVDDFLVLLSADPACT